MFYLNNIQKPAFEGRLSAYPYFEWSKPAMVRRIQKKYTPFNFFIVLHVLS